MSSLSKQLAAISASAPSAKPVSFLYSPETAASVDKETVTVLQFPSPAFFPHLPLSSSSSPPATPARPSASATAASRSFSTAFCQRVHQILRGNYKLLKLLRRLIVLLASCSRCCHRTSVRAACCTPGAWRMPFCAFSPHTYFRFFLDVKCHLILE
jgi:hypothetical protein